LKQVPAKLDEYKKGKYYLHAAQLIDKSVTELFDDDLLEIQALSDLRRELVEHKNVRKHLDDSFFCDC
jgi:hypothetical protein